MKKYFITGLAILLPLAVTIGIVVFIVNFLTEPFIGLVVNIFVSWGLKAPEHYRWIISPGILHYGSQIIILIGLFFLTVLLGFLAKVFLFKSLIRLSDYIMHRIPFINKVYTTSQEVIKALFYSPTKSFSKVVLVPFPSPYVYSVGLISGEALKACKAALNREVVSVFVPTTPNPTSGYLLMFKKEDVISLDMTVEEALKYIISCGVLTNEPGDASPKLPARQDDASQLL
jgi:uncharacterized membrane protein